MVAKPRGPGGRLGILSIVLELEEAIDVRTNTAGDPVTARVANDAKMKSQVVIPKGALVRGRIRELDGSAITLEFTEVQFEYRQAVFSAHRESLSADLLQAMPSLRVVYLKPLGLTFMAERSDPKQPNRRPTVPSLEESGPTPGRPRSDKHRALLTTLYGGGLRLSEADVLVKYGIEMRCGTSICFCITTRPTYRVKASTSEAYSNILDAPHK
jgi:hypothetical protein